VKTRQTMVLDVVCKVVPDRFGAERRAWAQVDPVA
jgi:para-nitrobenzyl esterase